MATGSPPPTPASRPLPGPRSFSPAAGQRERAGVDGASQALLEVQEGGAGTEAAPQRGDPLCRPAGREHLLTTEYWKHFKPLAIKPLAILNLWQPLHISTPAFEETVPLFGFYGCHGAHSAWRTQLGEECASGGRAGWLVNRKVASSIPGASSSLSVEVSLSKAPHPECSRRAGCRLAW